MSQIIKAELGGFGLALTDSINGGVTGLQYLLLALPDYYQARYYDPVARTLLLPRW